MESSLELRRSSRQRHPPRRIVDDYDDEEHPTEEEGPTEEDDEDEKVVETPINSGRPRRSRFPVDRLTYSAPISTNRHYSSDEDDDDDDYKKTTRRSSRRRITRGRRSIEETTEVIRKYNMREHRPITNRYVEEYSAITRRNGNQNNYRNNSFNKVSQS